MKIKDTLDLCGWELWNFCIQNHQNLEGLLDLGAGRKVFYTGNDQGKNGREVIYDGSKWKVSAYMSDVDELRGLITALENATDEEIEALKGRATTLEGRVDTIDNMLNVENSQTVVDTWEEVKKFLASVSEETDLITLLNGKANAGIENGKGYVALPYANNKQAFIFYNGGFEWSLTNEGWTGSHKILHQGNFANLITGTLGVDITGNAATADMLAKSYNENINYSQGTVGLKLIRDWSENGESLGFATKYQAGLSVVTDYVGWQMTSGGGSTENPYFRSMGDNGVWKPWRQIAFLTDNVASATKLATPRTIWGQSFDGTEDVGGTLSGVNNIYMNEGYRFYIGGVDSLYLYPSQKTIYIGYGAGTTYATAIAGNEVSLRYGGLNTGFILNSSGNVIIGPSSAEQGRLKIVGADGATDIFYVSDYTGNALFNIKGNGNALIGTPSPLNETSKLQIKGDLYVEGNIIATKEVSAGGAATEGNGGAGGFSLYESWGTSAPTEPLALGANLGYELKTRVEDLELAKTKVTFEPALASGKQIGTIEIDGNKTNLFAPATYAWSEITGTENVLLKSGGIMTGNLTIRRSPSVITFETADGSPRGSLGVVAAGPVYYDAASVGYDLLHSGNYSDYALPLSGGEMTGKLVMYNRISMGNQVIEMGKGLFGAYNDGEKLYWLTPSNETWNEILTSAGGTIDSGSNDVPLVLKSNAGTTWLKFVSNDGASRFIGVSDSNELKFQYGGTSYPILHSGNVGDVTTLFNTRASIKETSDLNDVESVGAFVTQKAINQPDPYTVWFGGLLNFSFDDGVRWQLWSTNTSHQTALFYRKEGSNTWSDWKTIAFTDSNVASATKLETPRTIWGQSFDGTADVSGDLHLNQSDIYWHYDKANYCIESVTPTDTSPYLKIAHYGGIAFHTVGAQKMLINSSGNVTIGASDLAGTGYKLYVDGLAYTYSFAATGSLSLNRNPNNGTIYNSAILALAIESSGDVITFGAYRGDSSKIGVPLAFSKSGNVGIGTINPQEKLDIEGGIRVNGHIYPKWGNNSDLGKNSQRWNNIFAVKASFTEDVIIDGDLHVKGNIIADGEVSAGGTGTEGGTSGGGTSTNPHVVNFTPSQETSHSFYHNLPYYDVVVQVYEKNAISGAWDMILADVTIANESNLVTVNFGRKENVEHKIVVR